MAGGKRAASWFAHPPGRKLNRVTTSAGVTGVVVWAAVMGSQKSEWRSDLPSVPPTVLHHAAAVAVRHVRRLFHRRGARLKGPLVYVRPCP